MSLKLMLCFREEKHNKIKMNYSAAPHNITSNSTFIFENTNFIDGFAYSSQQQQQQRQLFHQAPLIRTIPQFVTPVSAIF